MSNTVPCSNAVEGQRYLTKQGVAIILGKKDLTTLTAEGYVEDSGEVVGPIPFDYPLVPAPAIVDLSNAPPMNANDDVPGVAAKPGTDDSAPANLKQGVSVSPGFIPPPVAPPVSVIHPLTAPVVAVPAASPAPVAVAVETKSTKKKTKTGGVKRTTDPRILAAMETARLAKESIKQLRAENAAKKAAARSAACPVITGVECIDKFADVANKTRQGIPISEFCQSFKNGTYFKIATAFRRHVEGKVTVSMVNGIFTVVPRV
jgi:hypothetical protein